MERKIFHIRWNTENERGVLGVVYDECDWIYMQTLRGKDLQAKYLLNVLDCVLPDGWRNKALELFKNRKNPYRIESRYGQSGCLDITLKYVGDEKYADIRTGACLHVSMYGKLNQGLSLWLGDIPSILLVLEEEYPQEKIDSIEVKEVNFNSCDWIHPEDPFAERHKELVERCKEYLL